jgi:alkanesulfonate monooxygenase SsuD/methylene tetrahydromethanopterin reductase-like flavin-dependent oxidoreductase (luciferase family)
MQFGISVPNFGDYFHPRVLAELAQQAEACGWHGFFLWDHILFVNRRQLTIVDPWIALATIAMQTTSIRLGTLITPVARRRPWKLARETVSLDHLSNGRLILGVGLGHPPEDDFAQFGENPDAKVRAKKLDEGLDILTGLWRGQPFSYTGDYYQVQAGTQFLPPALQSPRIPVWVGGYIPHKAPFRRAARWDGVVPGRWDDQPLTPEDLRRLLTYINTHRTLTTPFDVVVSGETTGNHQVEDVEKITPFLEAGATWWIEPFGPWRGSVEVMRQRIQQGPPQLN